MNEMTELEHFRSEVPPPTPDALTAQEDRLLSAMAAVPATGRRRRRSSVFAGLLAAAGCAAAAVLGPTLISQDALPTAYANSAIAVELRGEEYVATIKDPFVDHARYTEAFKALGLDVTLDLRPASPSAVGTVFRLGFSGTTEKDRIGGSLEPEGCVYGRPGCALTITISKGFSGRGTIYMGRPAKPSEPYQNNADAGAKGESLEGYDPNGRTVAEVLAETRRRGLEVTFQIIEPAPDGNGFSMNPREQSAEVGDRWIVWAAEPHRQGAVRLLVSEKRVAKNPVHGGAGPE
ncbi:hypothetical protein Nocox_39900 [Nonomuraea coxensis DSM 45129]|uniref:PASTA domain-containing protein n=1 Tax=Nonomuraea coxensis DSM 45129 TaxID=1122611 RepID=A0ABX8UGJ4_9ACTN|nr:hypothetical protein [Nonomuraea coxensis]QYC45523.1 hypothetical protein Nocox_39900 [Nonomuraea coxensis DSM 45129]